MEQKHVVIAIAIVLLIGLAIAAGNFFTQSLEMNSNTTKDNSLSFNRPTVAPSPVNATGVSPTDVVQKQYDQFPGELSPDQLANKKAVLTTNKGVIEFNIDSASPKAASNFISLANDQFYNGLKFHRVVKGFVIQGGDPLGNGRGGPGYQFEDEPVTKSYLRGTVAMANAGPNTNGSQFFICLSDQPSLPPNYTIFGQVTKGLDVVDQIAVGDVMEKVIITSAN